MPRFALQGSLHGAFRLVAHGEVAFFQQVIDHALEAHGSAVVRVVDSGNAVVLKFGNFRR